MAPAADWPTYQHDNHRSGRTTEQIAAVQLTEQWAWESPQPPEPAWSGPARYDAYRSLRPLRSMRNYDPVFHVVAADGSIYFGSSVDDSVHCLDAATGTHKWLHTTDGPVRIAPTCADGKVYFGSDDGHAYCVRSEDGALVWKYSPAPPGRRILNNGRLIPLHPCRTGVLVEDGTAYFAAGMLPWEDSYLCAVDAASGRPEGMGRYVALYAGVPMERAGDAHREGITMEGALLASADRLFVPQGRVPPRMFARADGKCLEALEGGGGCFVLLTDDCEILHGPGNKTGWITHSNAKTGQKMASFEGGAAAVVSGNTIYVLTRTELSAVDRKTGRPAWTKACEYPYSLIMAGEALFTGGRDAVAAFSAADGTLLWSGAVSGKAHGLAAAHGKLLVTTDEGVVHCFSPGGAARAAETPASRPNGDEVADVQEPTPPQDLSLSPCLQFTGPDSAVVRWETDEPTPTKLEYGFAGDTRSIEDPAAKTWHEVTLTGLRKETIYTCSIRRPQGPEVVFECDTHFNYTLPAIPDRPSPCSDDEQTRLCSRAAEHILSRAGTDRGICLVLGCGQGRLAYELATRGGLRVIGVDTSATNVAQARCALSAAGIYGARVTVHLVDSLEELPFVGDFANLIVSEVMLVTGRCAGAAAEVRRLLRPDGGVALLGQCAGTANELSSRRLQAWLDAGSVNAEIHDGGEGLWARIVRPPLNGIGVWTHQYGRAANSAYGGESLQGAKATSDLAVQWVGRPGPRYQPDRNGRKPAPLAINGRLLGQGRRRIVALDAYNGTILWSLEIPGFARFNMPRDCGNWCADEDYVFAAVKDKCWRIDAADGRISKSFDVVPGDKPGWAWDWGYVADGGANVIGSAVKSGSAFVAFVGPENWYDQKEGPGTFKVCSEDLFALDKQSGRTRWVHTGGVIVNSTIAISGGRVHFVACRNPDVVASQSRRVGMKELWSDQFLVALDVASGKMLWERPIQTAPGSVVFFLACGDGKLVLMASDVSDEKYHTYAFDAAEGSPLWDAHFDWMSDNHGGHMSHPAIAGGRVFVRPRVLDLQTGELLDTPMPGGGCGTYAVTDHTAVFRSSHVTMWDFEADKSTSWHRLRPGCWLSTVPACGMILSPEAGGGCSCGSWLETSIAFMPRRKLS